MSYLKKLNYLLSDRLKRKLFLVLIFIIIGSALELLGISILLPIINLAVDVEHADDNMVYKIVTDITGATDFRSTFVVLLVITIVVYFAKNAYLAWMNAYNEKYANDVKRYLATRLMKAYMKEPYPFFLNHNSSDIIRSVNNDTSNVFQVVNNLVQVASLSLTTLALVIYLGCTNVKLTLIVTALLGICVLYIFFRLRRVTRRWGEQVQRKNGRLIRYVQQAFEGIKEIKILNSEAYYTEIYDTEYAEMAKLQLKSKLVGTLPKYMIEFVSVAGILTYLSYVIITDQDYTTLVAQMAIFAVTAFKLLPYVNSIYNYMNTVVYHRASIELVYRDIRMAEGDADGDKKGEAENEKTTLPFEKEIRASGVCFAYDGSQRDVVRDANVTIKKGESVAFIGPSGQGKTTMADLILGLLTPQEGDVTVDGVPIGSNIRGWHDHIGYIPQSIYLTDDSIRNNIAFGIPAKEIDDEQVWKALQDAQLSDFVKGLEKGLDTEVGERGTRLSGGQRQRIGIARALYRNPDVLVFDEATSALDTATETEVMNAINALHGTKTMLIIAHRLSTIEKCDKVYKVEDQKVLPQILP